jgi:hypothetical protein
VAAHAVAAFAVGSIVSPLTSTIARGFGLLDGTDVNLVDWLPPPVLVLVAVGLCLVTPLRRFGWLVAGAGLAVAAGLYVQLDALPAEALYVSLAVALGLQVGGVLLALMAAPTGPRWGIIIGLGLGLVAGRYAAGVLATVLHRSVLREAAYSDVVVIGLAVGLTVVAAVVLAIVVKERPGTDPPKWRAPVMGIVVAAVVGRVLMVGWQAVEQNLIRSSTGGVSEDQAKTMESLNMLAHVVVVVATVAVLVAVAYRRGGPDLARWVVVGFAAAAAGIGIPLGVAGTGGARALVVASAAAGGLLGAVAVRRLDSVFPWDAFGVAVAAVGLLLALPRGRLQLPALTPAMGAMVAAAVALALTAGLARLVDPGRPGLSGPEVGLSAGLGFAALILSAQELGPLVYMVNAPYGALQVFQGGPVVLAALALVVLFGLGRRAGRPHADAVPLPDAVPVDVHGTTGEPEPAPAEG